jgi:hypothetical protein
MAASTKDEYFTKNTSVTFTKCNECLNLTAADLQLHRGIQAYLRSKFRQCCDQINTFNRNQTQDIRHKEQMKEIKEIQRTLIQNEKFSPERRMTQCFHHRPRDYATALRDFGPQNLYYI